MGGGCCFLFLFSFCSLLMLPSKGARIQDQCVSGIGIVTQFFFLLSLTVKFPRDFEI